METQTYSALNYPHNTLQDHRFYGRRKGRRLSISLEKALDLLPLYSVDLQSSFYEVGRLTIEIGFGYGEHLLLQARTHPNTLFIGADPFQNAVAHVLRCIHQEGIKNIRLYPDDGRHVLEALPQHSVDEIFILFPDPWQKKGHHKRRFISVKTLALLHHVLKPAGRILLATDHIDYARWIKEKIQESGLFQVVCREQPALWIPTRYQMKGIDAYFFELLISP